MESIPTQVVPGKANILVVVGTRPEAIKMLPVIAALRASEVLRPVVVSTGQHAKMVARVLALADAGIDIDLAAGSPSATLCGLWSRVIERLEAKLMQDFDVDGTEKRSRSDIWGAGFPAAMLVHGDTTSAAAAAVAGFQLRIPVVHVEAGLRTGSPGTPFPEEMNRQLIDRLCAFHLAPTSKNEESLVREGIAYDSVFVTGNTSIDALAIAKSHTPEFSNERIAAAVSDSRPLVVVTAHRRENWGPGIEGIARGVAASATAHPEATFVVAAHPNPEVRATVSAHLEGHENVVLSGPLGYVEFVHLLAAASFAVSDSGGVQEEAPSLGTPVLVTRSSTERQEGIEAGTIELIGTDPDAVAARINDLLDHPEHAAAMAARENPYGDGRAAERIVAALEHLAGLGPEPQRLGSGFGRHVVLATAGFSSTAQTPSEAERRALAEEWMYSTD